MDKRERVYKCRVFFNRRKKVLKLFACLLYYTEESPKPNFNCSLNISFICNNDFTPVYKIELDRKERVLIQSEYWVQSEIDSSQFCHAANAAEWAQGNQGMGKLEIVFIITVICMLFLLKILTQAMVFTVVIYGVVEAYI